VFGAYYLVALVKVLKDPDGVNLRDLHPFAPFRRRGKGG
jgi:hypothetical protein